MKNFATYLLLALVTVAALFWYRGVYRPGAAGNIPPPAKQVLVRAEAAQLQDFVDRVEALGTTRASEAVEITADVTGKVVAVNFEDDQWVEKGEELVQLEAERERAQKLEAEVNLQEDERLLDHYKTLARSQAVSKTLLDEQQAKVWASRARLAGAEAELEDFTIHAPFSGMLGARRISPGSLVTPGTVITTLDAIDSLRVDFTVPERWLSRLQARQVIRAGSVAWPDREFHGEVLSIGSRVDRLTRAAQVRAQVDNSERLLRPGMLLTLTLFTEPRQVVSVSEMAVVKEVEDNYVYVIDAANTVSRRPVQLGSRHEGRVEIVEGLEAGERVVTEGTQKVSPGATVIVADGGPVKPEA